METYTSKEGKDRSGLVISFFDRQTKNPYKKRLTKGGMPNVHTRYTRGTKEKGRTTPLQKRKTYINL